MPIVRPPAQGKRGQVIAIAHRSEVLEGNPWQDPVERSLHVYLPPSYAETDESYPALWDLAAFTNSGPGHLNWRNQGENLIQRLDRLIGSGKMRPVVVAMPDCYTSLGGNQYVNSAGTGAYADYLVSELVPLLSGRVNVRPDRAGRGVFGKSSGGYGALMHVMQHSGCWGAAAIHSGDVGFEWLYRPEFPAACRTLAEYAGDPGRFLNAFWRMEQPRGSDYATLLIIAMAATYDPDPAHPGVVRLPFDPETCDLIPERWDNWLRHDPLNLVAAHVAELQSLRSLYIDVGCRDEYNIQFGSRKLSGLLEKHGIRHHFEEHDGTHRGLDKRLDISLPLLAQSLSSGDRERQP